jgi:hypothetical protein
LPAAPLFFALSIYGVTAAMIVYGEAEWEADPRGLLRDIARRLRDLSSTAGDRHDALRAELIRLGEVEAGLGDALCPDEDRILPKLERLRRISVQLGRLFWRSWRGSVDHRARAEAAGISQQLSGLLDCPWPAQIRLRPPEGYAHYALYPESYGEAADRVADETGCASAVVIGVRSIGTSLSAVVAGVLEERGIDVASWCVRPRGHPFARSLVVHSGLSDAWTAAARRGSLALVVDEGPGLSGSSFLSVEEALERAGFASGGILLMPSWDAPAPPIAGAAARRRWEQLQKRPTVPVDAWRRGERTAGAILDLSAGRWRQILLAGRCWPAVQPQHERTKYLVSGEDGSRTLWKFAGLGAHGGPRLARASALAEAGYVPSVHGLRNGFLVHDFAEGRPLRRRDLDKNGANRMAAYIAFRARAFPTGRAVRLDALREMVRVNLEEGLGPGCGAAAERLLGDRGLLEHAGTVAVDSRMMPHEWLDTPAGVLKTDAVDHADDHFFPRDQDPAWDVAGLAAEFALGAEGEGELANLVAQGARDPRLPLRVGFYAIAYRAFHLGYAELAMTALGQGDRDGARFRRRAMRLRRELCARLQAQDVPAKSRADGFGVEPRKSR